MKTYAALSTLMIFFVAQAYALPQSKKPDPSREVLTTRAKIAPAPFQIPPSQEPRSNLLFSFNGPDNAACVRAIPDINGDGRDEILVGLDLSQQDNLYCLDGASSGTATVVWKLMTNDGVSGGGFYGDECLWPSSDVDQNGYDNFLAGTAWGGRTAYNLDGLDGSTIWKLDTYTLPNTGWIYSLQECGDVNGDSVPEAFFGTGSSLDRIFMIDGASTGANPTVLWQYPAGDATYTVRCMGDVNGDGKADVLGAVGDNADKVVCLSGTNGVPVWTYNPPGKSVYACGVLPSINGDDVNEALAVLWTGDGSAIRCLDGINGSEIWSSSDVLSYGMAVDILEDVTQDGIEEIVVSSWENAVTVLNGADGNLVWKTFVGTLNGGDVWTARAIPDLNGDTREDVIAGSFDYYVYAMDGDSGEVFWKYFTNNRVFSVYPVGDLNEDGRPEVAAGTQDTTSSKVVYVLEGDSGIPWPGLTLLGTGAIGDYFGVEVTGDPGWIAIIMFSTGTSSIPVPPFGIFELAFPIFLLPQLLIPPEGPLVVGTTIPHDPSWIGLSLYFQALVALDSSTGSFTDMEGITFY